MEPATRVAPRAKPGTPRTPLAGDAGAPVKPLARVSGEASPDLLRAALICNADGCPPEEHMQICQMQEDDDDGDACSRCWVNYFFWVANAGGYDAYRRNRLYEGGVIG